MIPVPITFFRPLINGNSGVIALFGDSLEGQAISSNTTLNSEECSKLSRNYQNWVNWLSPKGRWDNWYGAGLGPESVDYIGQNKGVGGDQTSDMRARLSDLMALKGLAIVGVGGGTNNISTSTTSGNRAARYAAAVSDLTTIYQTIIAGGAKLIILSIPPRPTSVWASGSDARGLWMDICSWMQGVADGSNIAGIGPANCQIVRRDLICSNNDSDRTPITGYIESDNVHLTPIGGYHVAFDSGGWSEKLSKWVAPFTNFPADAVSGELWFNPTLTGSGGTSGTGTSGSWANNITAKRSSGSTGVTIAGSLESNPNGGQNQIVTVTRDGAGSTATFTIGTSSGDITSIPTAGSWLRGWVYIKANASSAFQGISLRVREQPSGSNMNSQSMKTDTGLPWPNSALEGWQSTFPWQVRASGTSIFFWVQLDIDNTSAGTDVFRIERMHLIPETDPRPSLGFSTGPTAYSSGYSNGYL